MIINLNNINEIPEKTYKWLNVNRLNAGEIEIDEIEEYKKDIFEKVQENGYRILPYDDKINQEITDKIKERKYGTSKELVDLAERLTNSSYIIDIEPGAKIEKPIVINYELSDSNKVLFDNIIILSGEASLATVIINYRTSDNKLKGFHNGLLKIYAKKAASIKVIKFQNLNENTYNFDSNVAIIDDNANVEYIPIELGAKVTAPNYISFIDGQESSSNLKSIYIGSGDTILDLLYNMSHFGQKGLGNIESRGILMNNAKKVFKGIIDLKKGCIKSKGEEEEKVVLLDPTVKSYAIPLLLCSEEDVEGAHAASSGRIDEMKLFYLMSRGFSEKEAKKIVIQGYFEEIIENINCQKIREEIIENINRRLD